MIKLLIDQIGYKPNDTKIAIANTDDGHNLATFYLKDAKTEQIVFKGVPSSGKQVPGWKKGYFHTLDFSQFTGCGSYYLEVNDVTSYSFEIQTVILDLEMMMSLTYYFRGQRDVGEWEAQDKHVMFQDQRPERIDASGGWFDATGDYGIHLSHLTHSSYYTPQQTSLTAYVFYKAHEILNEWYKVGDNAKDAPPEFFSHLLAEGTYGADHLMRRAAPSGSFYRSIRRGMREFGPEDRTRHIGYELRRSSAQFGNAFTAKEETVTQEFYEVGFRMGGGLAIAALAIAARHPYPGQNYSCNEYLETAIRSFHYLLNNNERYVNDGHWNLIDCYAALIAATEIYLTTKDSKWYHSAAQMMRKTIGHAVPVGDDMVRWNVDCDIPFAHAAEAGLPVISLMIFHDAAPETEDAEIAYQFAERAMRYETMITDEVNNPFGYPRYTWKDKDGNLQNRFFFPHETTVSPWWQGENARIASLSTAARFVTGATKDSALKKRLSIYAQQCMGWINGTNPFGICMIHGFGHKNARYFGAGHYRLQCPGGICNGITSGIDDENGIEFIYDVNQGSDDNWRWGEQWIPHASWYMFATAMKYYSKPKE